MKVNLSKVSILISAREPRGLRTSFRFFSHTFSYKWQVLMIKTARSIPGKRYRQFPWTITICAIINVMPNDLAGFAMFKLDFSPLSCFWIWNAWENYVRCAVCHTFLSCISFEMMIRLKIHVQLICERSWDKLQPIDETRKVQKCIDFSLCG